MARTIHCIKLDKEAEGLDFAPYPGELGKRILKAFRKKRGLHGLNIKRCW